MKNKAIVVLWARCILEGKKTFEEVPYLLKEDVKKVLIKENRSDLLLD